MNKTEQYTVNSVQAGCPKNSIVKAQKISKVFFPFNTLKVCFIKRTSSYNSDILILVSLQPDILVLTLNNELTPLKSRLD